METVGDWRALLQTADQEIRAGYASGRPGLELVRLRTQAVDTVVCQVYRVVVPKGERDSLVLLAVGGYGRGHLAPGSDVDLLFFHATGRDVDPVLGRLERLLWDAGLRLSNTCRQAQDLVAALSDPATATSCIDARPVVGHRPLELGFRGVLADWRRREGAGLATRLFQDLARDSVSALRELSAVEPNLKQSPFLLRDIQRLFWISWLLAPEGATARFGQSPLLAAEATRDVLAAYDFLLRVRVGLHLAAGRTDDVLRLPRQPELAAQLGYRADGPVRAEERFLHEFYTHARAVYLAACQVVEVRERDPRFHPLSRRQARRWPMSANLVRVEDELHLAATPAACWGSPPVLTALVEPFEVLARTRLHLPFALLNALRQGVALSPEPNAAERLAAGAAWRRILGAHRPVGHLLASMHMSGLLGRLVPEFGALTCLAPFDLYHQFTLDTHSILAVAELDRLTGGQANREMEPYRVLFEGVADLAALRFGVLLHDCARLLGPNHAERGAPLAAAAAARLGFGEDAVADIAFVVRHHLLLSSATQHRDTEDPALIRRVADTVQTRPRLNLLFLTTFADMRCVRDGVWTGWKAEQLWALYRLLAEALERSPADPAAYAQELALYRPASDSPLSVAAIERHVALMAWPEYARRTPLPVIGEHLRLALAHRPGAVEMELAPGVHSSLVRVVADDAPGLFSRLVGALAAAGADVLTGACFTRRDGVAIDEFEVQESRTGRPLPAERLEPVRAALQAVHQDGDALDRLLARRRRSFPDRPAPPGVQIRVTVDNRLSQDHSIVEVRAADRTGLLCELGGVFERHRLNVRFVKIATHAGQAVDAFYVLTADGDKLREAEAGAVVADLTAVVGGGMEWRDGGVVE